MLEARDRVGGRTHSRELPNGAVVEMGAEFILPGNTVVEETAARLGLGLWEKGMAYGRREPRGGGAVTQDDLRAAAAAIAQALQDPEAERGSAAALLDGLPIGDQVREAILSRVEISTAARAEDVGADGSRAWRRTTTRRRAAWPAATSRSRGRSRRRGTCG